MRRRPTLHGLLKCTMCQEEGRPYFWHPPESFYTRQRVDSATGQVVIHYDCYCRVHRNAYSTLCRRTRYRVDPDYREQVKSANRRRKQAEAKETAGFARARRKEGQRLVGQLMERGWRQVDIAAAIGVHKVSVCRWSRGKHPPEYEAIKALRALARQVEAGTITPPKMGQRSLRASP